MNEYLMGILPSVVESTVVESVGKALASVEEALISVKQTFGPSGGGGGGGGHVDKNGNAAAVLAVPPTPPPVRSVRVKTESSLASVNITGKNGQHDLKLFLSPRVLHLCTHFCTLVNSFKNAFVDN